MREETSWLPVGDGVQLYVHSWHPDGPPKAVLMIAHGAVEHGGRYRRLAQYLTDAGYCVVACDHRGHGRTAAAAQDRGYFAPERGFERVVEDLYRFNRSQAEQHPETPIYLFGHSMGAIVGQNYVMDHADSIDGVILSSVGNGVGALYLASGTALALLERARLGPRGRSPVLQFMIFGDFNRRFAPNRTDFDWLSRDDAEVDKYVADPLCGGELTVQGWLDLFSGMKRNERLQNLRQFPADKPVLLLCGSRDPVARNGAAQRWLVRALRRAGVRNVEEKCYPDGRHEMLNELNRDEVHEDIRTWLDGKVAQRAAA